MAESPKCSFMLISANPSDLPPLSPCKFSAPKILRIQKARHGAGRGGVAA